jgi:CBS domain-containing protein
METGYVGRERRAEVAFAVLDEHQGRGIATQLLAQLLPFARRNGITALDAEVLGDNIHMLHVFSRMGFVVSRPPSGGTLQLTLRIEPAGAPAARRPSYGFLGLKVADAMTREVVTIAPEAEIVEIEAIFERSSFNGLPVVDGSGRLLGMVTKLDLLRAFAFSERTIVPHYDEISRLRAESVMTRDPLTVAPDLPLTRTLEQLVQTRFKSFPVVANGRLAGIVSREDVLRALRRTTPSS